MKEVNNVIQLELEQRIVSNGITKREGELEKKVKSGYEDNTKYGHTLVENLQEATLFWLEAYVPSGVARRSDKLVKHSLYKLYTDWQEDDDAKMEENPLLELSNLFALAVISKLNTYRELQRLTRHLHRSYCQTFNVDWRIRDELFKEWGSFFLKLIQAMEGRCDVYSVVKHRNTMSTIEVSVNCEQWLTEISDLFILNNRGYKPMVVKPLPHKNLIDGSGGFLTLNSPLLKKPHNLITKENFNDETHPEFFKETNKHQETGYCINHKLLNVLKAELVKDNVIGEYHLDVDRGIKEATEKANEEIVRRNKKRKEWAESHSEKYTPLKEKACKKAHKNHQGAQSFKKVKILEAIADAEEYKDYPEFFYPVFFDFRGRRYYYSTNYLQPQGDELSKALLQFSKKEAFTAEGITAVYEVLGNALGYDKEKKADKRIMALHWWCLHREELLNGDFSVFFNESEMDEPLTALSISLELVEWEKDKSYKSGMIAHQDARCSGIQIQGALQQDVEASRLTSLIEGVEGERLPDPYLSVLDKTLELVKNTEGAEELLLPSNQEHLFQRKVFKYPTMTRVSYGATGFSIRRLNSDHKNDTPELKELSQQALNLFSSSMMTSLDGAVESCSNFLTTARRVCLQAAKEKGVIHFNAPLTGFPVCFHKSKEVEFVVKVRVDGVIKKTKFVRHTGEKNVRKMASSAAPSIIHAIDGAMLTQMGIELDDTINLSTIHDSIGSHPNNCKAVLEAYNSTLHQLSQGKQLDKVFSEILGESFTGPYKGTMTDNQVEGILTATHTLT